MKARNIENVRHYLMTTGVALNVKDVMRIFNLTERQIFLAINKSYKIGDTTLVTIDSFFGLISKLDTEEIRLFRETISRRDKLMFGLALVYLIDPSSRTLSCIPEDDFEKILQLADLWRSFLAAVQEAEFIEPRNQIIYLVGFDGVVDEYPVTEGYLKLFLPTLQQLYADKYRGKKLPNDYLDAVPLDDLDIMQLANNIPALARK